MSTVFFGGIPVLEQPSSKIGGQLLSQQKPPRKALQRDRNRTLYGLQIPHFRDLTPRRHDHLARTLPNRDLQLSISPFRHNSAVTSSLLAEVLNSISFVAEAVVSSLDAASKAPVEKGRPVVRYFTCRGAGIASLSAGRRRITAI